MKTNRAGHSFYKYSGAGNTFLISSEKLNLDLNQKKELVKKICHPVDGFCADGVLFLEQQERFVVWDFYNSDGSVAEMCGNAARCAYSFAESFLDSEAKKIDFKTLAGVVGGYRQQDLVAIEMTPLKSEAGNLEKEAILKLLEVESLKSLFETEVISEQLLSIDTGVPHLVFEIKDFDNFKKLKNLGALLRGLKVFPRGTNVTMVSVENKKTAKAVTYERGVEDFTLACGTGAVAAAKFVSLIANEKKIQIKMPGGNLKVEFSNESKSPVLLGEAKFIGKIIIDI